MKYQFKYHYPLFDLCYVEEDGYIIKIMQDEGEENAAIIATPIILLAHEEMMAYLEGKLKQFSVPYKLIGTPFQLKVLHELEKIPYGETVSYKSIACKVGNPKASRAVGGAIHNNPIGIIVPCHRVIGSNQKLIGYAGGLDMKSKLLDLEKAKYRI